MTEHTDFDLELRFVDTDDGSMTGICVPYGKTSWKAAGSPSGERFLPGAFAASVKRRGPGAIRLVDFHKNGVARRPYGVATDLVDTPEGLVGTFRFYPTPTGQEGRTEVRAGTYGGLSIGFKPRRVRRAPDGVREIMEAELHHVALVDEPAYADAAVLAVRETRSRSPYADWTPPDVLVEIPNVLSR